MLKADQIDPDRDEDPDVKGDPKPNVGGHGGEIFTPEAWRQPQIAYYLCLSRDLWRIRIEVILSSA